MGCERERGNGVSETGGGVASEQATHGLLRYLERGEVSVGVVGGGGGEGVVVVVVVVVVV